MTDFDPAEFDTLSPKAAPGEDYRELLKAMREAGAQGVRDETARLSQAVASMVAEVENVRNSARWLSTSAERYETATVAHYAKAVVALLAAVFAVGFVIRWAQEPKIERQFYGCTAGWDAKTQTCKGKWVPLVTKGS